MKLAVAIEGYIAYKRALGMIFRSDAVRLHAYLAAVGDQEMDRVRPQQVRRYLDGHGPITSFWFAKYGSLSGFYRYAIARQYVRKSPLPLSKPQAPERFQPHIYTNQEMQQLIDAANTRHRYVWLLDPRTVRMMLLLLYGTGMRIGETLALNIGDYDNRTGVLTIRSTKFFKSRLVPIGPSLQRVLDAYLLDQWPVTQRKTETPLLGTRTNKRIFRQTAELVFKRLRQEAQVVRSPDASFQPRLHDFRHTFAVVRLVTWYREGKDVQRLLPHLTTYLGHGRIRDTQRYLTMTTELLAEASRCFEQYARPEASHA